MILPIDQILVAGMQIRAQLCEEVVADYCEAMMAGAKFPALAVFHDGENYWLADGFHRIEACKRAGFGKVKAEVYQGQRIDALKHAFGANQTHGMRMSNEDKRQAVLVAYENRIALGLGEVPSARAVAEVVGVSDMFVASQLQTVCSWAEATERQGSDGKTRKVPPVPTRDPAQHTKLGARFPIPPSRGGSGESAPSGNGGSGETDKGLGGGELSPPSTVVPTCVNDMLGVPVPRNLAELWVRRTEVLEVVKSLQKSRLAVVKAQEAGDVLWGNFGFSSVMMHIDNALAHVKGAVPHCVCPYCQGVGCRVCISGLLPLSQYERLPREMKKGAQ
jgi:hypothetical protein